MTDSLMVNENARCGVGVGASPRRPSRVADLEAMTGLVSSSAGGAADQRAGGGGRFSVCDGVDGRPVLGKKMSTYSLKNSWRLKYQDFLPVDVSSSSSSSPTEKSEPVE